MIRTIKCDYCHGENAVRLSFPGDCVWHTEVTIDPSTGLSDQHEVYVCKDCGKVMLKKVGETLEIVEKIFDAEGVPIEVGDMVYCDDDPEPFKVVLLDDQKCVYLALTKNPNDILLYKMESSRLSHKRPILDADGVPIDVGDDVYSVPVNVNGVIYSALEKGKAYTVERIEANGGNYLVDIAEAKDRWPMYSVSPENLTHERFDSWEQLEEDMMRGTSCRYFGVAVDCQDCPHGIEQTDVPCWKNERIDILKRAKKLAGIKEEARNDD